MLSRIVKLTGAQIPKIARTATSVQNSRPLISGSIQSRPFSNLSTIFSTPNELTSSIIATCLTSWIAFFSVQENTLRRNHLYSLSPVLRPAPLVSAAMSDEEILARVRTLFSSPEILPHLNLLIAALINQDNPIDPQSWIGSNKCSLTSIGVMLCLRHLGLTPKLMETRSMRMISDAAPYECRDHAWVEIDTVGGRKLKEAIIIDLTCRQYTGYPMHESMVDVPHGAIAFSSDFDEWAGEKALYWANSIDSGLRDSSSPYFKVIDAIDNAIRGTIVLGSLPDFPNIELVFPTVLNTAKVFHGMALALNNLEFE